MNREQKALTEELEGFNTGKGSKTKSFLADLKQAMGMTPQPESEKRYDRL